MYLHDFHSFPWALGGALYILGAVLYMLRVPERFSPGSFDLVVSFKFLRDAAIGVLASAVSLADSGRRIDALHGRTPHVS